MVTQSTCIQVQNFITIQQIDKFSTSKRFFHLRKLEKSRITDFSLKNTFSHVQIAKENAIAFLDLLTCDLYSNISQRHGRRGRGKRGASSSTSTRRRSCKRSASSRNRRKQRNEHQKLRKCASCPVSV